MSTCCFRQASPLIFLLTALAVDPSASAAEGGTRSESAATLDVQTVIDRVDKLYRIDTSYSEIKMTIIISNWEHTLKDLLRVHEVVLLNSHGKTILLTDDIYTGRSGMAHYKAALIGCSRMGAFIDNEVSAARRPYSHAAGYEACAQTDLVSCSDVREEVMEQVGLRYGVALDKQYTDYREMLEREQPDIVSVATQPEQRTEIIEEVAASSARAIYAEKALCASMGEADRIVEACESNDVILNMGTNRRWDRGFDTMKEIIDSGQVGALKSIIHHSTSTLFNGASHSFDIIQRLNSDAAAVRVQAELSAGAEAIKGEVMGKDPVGHGIIIFENDVIGYALNSSRGYEIEAICEGGVMTSLRNGQEWLIRTATDEDDRGRADLEKSVFPEFERKSSTLCLVEDLVDALDTGEAPRGGVRVAWANMELIFAFVESHMRGGARVELPLESSRYRLDTGWRPREPRFEPA